MISYKFVSVSWRNRSGAIIIRNSSTLNAIKALAKSTKVRISEWKALKIPPTQTQKPLKNRYIPFSKRFLFREIISDPNVVSPSSRDVFEDLALYVDEKISKQYRLQSEEITLLFQPLMDVPGRGTVNTKVAEAPAPTDLGGDRKGALLGRKERLDHEYWFLRKLEEIAPDGGFAEVAQDALQAACMPRGARSARVKTYVDPADYDVLRVWTRGLHPSTMYPIDRSLGNRPPTAVTGLPLPGGGGSKGSSRFEEASSAASRLVDRLTRLVSPRAMAAVPRGGGDLCYGHVLIAYRLKGDDMLRLRMMKHVPVSGAAAGANAFAEGVVDMLPEHRYLGLSEGARSLVVAGAAIGLGGLGVLTPLAHLLLPASASVSPELVLAWSFSATCTAGATAALVALRYWKARADWSERLRRLSLACEFNSGRFALAHLLGLSQAELFKSALLVYSLLLQPSEGRAPLTRSQLEIRAESWIAKRLSPHTHISLPHTTERSFSSRSSFLTSLFKRRAPKDEKAAVVSSVAADFNGGSGPLFDLQFDAGPALAVLRQLDLVRGSDEDGLEAVSLHGGLPVSVRRCDAKHVSPLSAFLSPESQEDDLGFPRVAIQQ